MFIIGQRSVADTRTLVAVWKKWLTVVVVVVKLLSEFGKKMLLSKGSAAKGLRLISSLSNNSQLKVIILHSQLVELNHI